MGGEEKLRPASLKSCQSEFENGNDKGSCCSCHIQTFCDDSCKNTDCFEPKPLQGMGRQMNYSCCDQRLKVEDDFDVNNGINIQNPAGSAKTDSTFRWQGGIGVPGLEASIHQV